MKKILSLVLTALMLVGTFTIGASAIKATNDQMLKFDDTTFKEGGGNVGNGTVDLKKLFTDNGYNFATEGYTISMDFVFGREGGPCFHPTDVTQKHTSKFAAYLGESEGTHKYVGYSATEDRFFLGVCTNSPFSGEGLDGIEFLASSEQGLVNPGQVYRLDMEFVIDTGFNLYVDGELIISFDLYEDLDYPTYFPHSYFIMYPTHITCAVDNVAVYRANKFDPATGEGVLDYDLFSDFEDAKMETKDVVDETTGEVTGTTTTVTAEYWGLSEAYTLTDPAEDIYCQPQYDVEEGQANVIFQSWLDKKANGASEVFGSGKDFTINLTMANNPGFDTVELDLLNDEFITVKEVAAADGLTAKLEGSKLTITGEGYTGEALATLTYTLSASAVQGYFYRYGAKVETMKVSAADGEVDAVLSNGISKVYNYTADDMNDDGKFNLADVTIILKFVAKWTLPQYFKEAGDVNDDGRVNNMDVSYYLRWIAGWKGYTIGGITNY